MKIEGQVFCLNRPNIDTDQIIPANHLTGVSMKGCGVYLFEGVPDLDPNSPLQNSVVLVSGGNFGCGSSREHAVWALEGRGFKAVIAPSFARIFRQNAFNRGFLLIELPPEQIEKVVQGGFRVCEIYLSDTEAIVEFFVPGVDHVRFSFQLSEFEKTLVLQGGLVGFAAARY